tara:strand:- start:738 stop:1586 length:849 start_codon:yes stop_codon:yes gene_type:complete
MSVIFGVLAALAWGVHDLLVRQVSQRLGTVTALSTVLALSVVLLLAALLILPNAGFTISPEGVGLCVLSGLTFAVASFSLYRAFEIGPVRLVAPIIGAYPVISMAWASVFSVPAPLSDWLAVAVVIFGVALVVVLSEKTPGAGDNDQSRAVIWALLAAISFAFTFIIGQPAVNTGHPLALNLVTRCVAFAVMSLVVLRSGGFHWPGRKFLPLLAVLAVLDALALGLVLQAGGLAHPEYASVAASTFGMVTIILAWAFLKEEIRPSQWGAAATVFAAIAYLGI